MTSSMLRGVRRGFVLLAAGTIVGTGGTAFAQTPPPSGAVVQPLPGGDGGAELRRHLADLAANPRSVTSLIGAGRAAIQVGDAQAALGFFGRAEEIAPRDARVKAGMASAFVLLAQPQAALRLFVEAAQLGAPDIEIARDRGLAYDMIGNPRRAQQDYALVLQRGDDAETRRRLALSLAISGNRDAALRMLDPLLRRHDRAAFRTRAFALALTGDANGAVQAVNAAMPGQGAAMAPFLSRLAGLNPAQKAMAVHFGHFPADGRTVRMAEAVDTRAHPAAVALSGGRPNVAQPTIARQPAPSSSSQTAVRRRFATAPPVSPEPRRRPDAIAEIDRSDRIGPGSRSVPARSVAPRPQQMRQQTPAAQPTSQPVQVARSEAQLPAATAPARAEPVVAEPRPGFAIQAAHDPSKPEPQQPAEETTLTAAEPVASPSPGDASPETASARVPSSSAETAPTADRTASTPPSAPAAGAAPPLADIAALVESLPAEQPGASPAASRQRPASSATRPARTAAAPAATRSAARPPAPPPHPSRHWVQLAQGERAAFGYQLGRIRQSAPELLRGRNAWYARNGSSNRLLVGPFATSAEARAFVSQLSRQRVDAFAWTSAAGEEVARLPAR